MIYKFTCTSLIKIIIVYLLSSLMTCYSVTHTAILNHHPIIPIKSHPTLVSL